MPGGPHCPPAEKLETAGAPSPQEVQAGAETSGQATGAACVDGGAPGTHVVATTDVTMSDNKRSVDDIQPAAEDDSKSSAPGAKAAKVDAQVASASTSPSANAAKEGAPNAD